MDLHTEDRMVSFDLVSLFTKVPALEEISTLLCNDDTLEEHTTISMNDSYMPSHKVVHEVHLATSNTKMS